MKRRKTESGTTTITGSYMRDREKILDAFAAADDLGGGFTLEAWGDVVSGSISISTPNLEFADHLEVKFDDPNTPPCRNWRGAYGERENEVITTSYLKDPEVLARRLRMMDEIAEKEKEEARKNRTFDWDSLKLS